MQSNFINFMQSVGIDAPDHITPGKIARFGKGKEYWAILFDDGVGGVVGNWKTGEQQVWQSQNAQRMSAAEKARFTDAIQKAKAEAKALRAQGYRQAAITAQELWDGATNANPNHLYLKNKWVGAYGIKQQGHELLIPVYSVDGDMQSIQFIAPNGVKRFLAGGQMSGGCHMIGYITKDEPITICEGYATGATLYEQGNPFVVVAFSASNLIKVAKALKERLPRFDYVIAGDDDWQTENNPGKTHAIEAAKKINCTAIFPNFDNERRQAGETDFNDLFRSVNANQR